MDFLRPTYDPARAVRDLAAGVLATVHMARGLVGGNRAVDLAGLDNVVGLLCAKAFDLPTEQGREIRPELIRVAKAMDDLAAALAQHASLG